MQQVLDLLTSTVKRRQMRDALVVHLHVPKTSGISIRRMLHDVYGDRLLAAHPVGWPQVLPDDAMEQIRQKPQFFRAYSGHHAFGVHEIPGGQRATSLLSENPSLAWNLSTIM
jgi:hypothetical protein